jgi:alpha-L-glutamate ligase-like protein
MRPREARSRLAEMVVRRAGVIGINRRNVELVHRENPRQHFPFADDKELAKQRLEAAGVPVPRTLMMCRGLFAIPGVLEQLAQQDGFVVKPACGAAGKGVLVVGQRKGPGRWEKAGGGELTAEKLRRHLAQIVFGAYSKRLEDRAMVEERIVAHEVFRSFYSDGLSDVRVVLLRSVPVMAMVRVPTERSGGRANLHTGGIGLGVDLDTGRITRAWWRRRSIEVHPETGARLVGVELPFWEDVIRIAVRASGAVPLGYLGVDVAIDRTVGPVVLEINARAGLEIQNVCGQGLASQIERRVS